SGLWLSAQLSPAAGSAGAATWPALDGRNPRIAVGKAAMNRVGGTGRQELRRPGGDETLRRRVELRLALEEAINHAEDHVIILDLGPAGVLQPRVESLGKSFSVLERGPVIV